MEKTTQDYYMEEYTRYIHAKVGQFLPALFSSIIREYDLSMEPGNLGLLYQESYANGYIIRITYGYVL